MSQVSMTNPSTRQTQLVDLADVPYYSTLGYIYTGTSLGGQMFFVSVTIGPESSHVINVALQLENPDSSPLANTVALHAYLSDVASGKTITTTAPDGGVAIGSQGGCLSYIAGKAFLLTFEPSGALDLNIQNSVPATWYLTLILPSGVPLVFGPIAF
jgi:hypothetical protein